MRLRSRPGCPVGGFAKRHWPRGGSVSKDVHPAGAHEPDLDERRRRSGARTRPVETLDEGHQGAILTNWNAAVGKGKSERHVPQSSRADSLQRDRSTYRSRVRTCLAHDGDQRRIRLRPKRIGVARPRRGGYSHDRQGKDRLSTLNAHPASGSRPLRSMRPTRPRAAGPSAW